MTAPELRTLFGFMKQIFILLFPHQQKCPVQIQCSVPPLGIGIAERFLAFCPADENGFYGNAGEGCVISLGEPPGEEAGHSSGGDGGGYGGACFRVREMELDGGTASRTALSVCRGRREVPGKIPGPCTLTPGAARSGLICPVAVKPRLLWM